ncbi:MAG: hypothetical protein PHG02_06815 [Oscillospiraceae bacterium]|nr:hypothetical protein [Oscillospiraceae bacterium]
MGIIFKTVAVIKFLKNLKNAGHIAEAKYYQTQAQRYKKHFANQKNCKGEVTMKKSTFVALLVFLAAVAGALGAAYMYLKQREEELDEYERLLFSEDFSEDAELAQEAEPAEPAPVVDPE